MSPRLSLLVAAPQGGEPLRRTLASVHRQDAGDWEVVVARPGLDAVPDDAVPDDAVPDDAVPDDAVPGDQARDDLTDDDRVRVVTVPDAADTPDGDLGPLLAAALAAARGQAVGVLLAGDELEPGALTAALTVWDADPGLDVVYTDEQWPGQGADGIATKPDWSPQYLQSYPYLGRLCLVRTEVATAAGGFRTGFPGAEEWDLALRVTEATRRVGHVPVVGVSRPTAPRADDAALLAGVRAVQGRVDRSGRPGTVEPGPVPRSARLWWSITDEPLVSVVVPTAGGRRTVHGEDSVLVERCLRSLVESTTYRRWEVVLVTSAHTPADVVPRLRALLGDRLRTTGVEGPFNFSHSVNEGARLARGELLLLLNDDTEVVEPRWLERMVSVAQDPEVGVVGAKLIFENGTIQHVGVIFDDRMGPIHPLGSEVHDDGRFGSKVLDLDYLAVTGACLLTPMDVFRQVGGLSVDLPLNFNDVDYCLKVAATGRHVVNANFAQLHHYESSTRGHAYEQAELDYLERHWGVRRTLDPHVHYRSRL